MDGMQIQMLSYLGKTWGMGDPRFTNDQVIAPDWGVYDGFSDTEEWEALSGGVAGAFVGTPPLPELGRHLVERDVDGEEREGEDEDE